MCLLAGRTPKRPRFNVRLENMGFVVGIVAVEEVSSEHFRCPPSVIFYQNFGIIYLFTYSFIHLPSKLYTTIQTTCTTFNSGTWKGNLCNGHVLIKYFFLIRWFLISFHLSTIGQFQVHMCVHSFKTVIVLCI